MHKPDEIQALDTAIGEVFAEADIPALLRPSIERHRTNLIQLVQTLQAAGIDERQIELSVNTIVASYKSELMQAVKTLMKGIP